MLRKIICVVIITQGGGVAAPIASQVLGEVLPYLEIKKDNETEEDIKTEVEVPNVEGQTIKDATNELEELGLNIEVKCSEETEDNAESNSEGNQSIIIEQLPKAGIKVKQGTNVVAYY